MCRLSIVSEGRKIDREGGDEKKKGTRSGFEEITLMLGRLEDKK